MREALRRAAGPVFLGLGVWAAAGSITPSAIETPTVRIGVPAGPLWAVAGALIALAVGSLRRYPWLATPALLTVLPWLPTPVPEVTFMWTGRLAWFPIGLVLLGAWLSRQTRPGVAQPDAITSGALPQRDAWLAAGGTLVALVLAAVSLAPSLPGGDEPHYLVITQSLLRDRDLRIQNNHDRRDYEAYHPGPIEPHFIRRGIDGDVYSIHAPGVSALVAPGFAAFGYRGAQTTIMALTAATAGLIWLIAWQATRDRSAAWFAWAAVACSVTFLVQGITIFPDGPGACIAALAALTTFNLAAGRLPTAGVVFTGVTLASLPFLHSRFASLAGLLGLAVVLRLVALTRGESWQRQARVVGLLAAPAIVGLILWLGYFWMLYGTVDPRAPYGTTREFSARFAPGGFLGLLFDQQFGLLAYAPVLGLAAFGAIRTGPARWLFLAAVGYAGIATFYWMWWAGGPAPPARLATAALPLLAAPIAAVWHRGSSFGRQGFAVLLGTSVATTVVVLWGDGARLFANFRTGRALWLDWLGTSADLPRLWPSFFWRLDPNRLATEWAFITNAAIWAATITLVFFVCRAAAGAQQAPRQVLAALWWLPMSAMLSATLVASVDGAPVLRPAQAQVTNLASAVRSRVLVIDPGRISRRPPDLAQVRIRIPRVEVPASARAEWLTLRDVPAGRYRITIRSRRPRGGALHVQGPGRSALADFTLSPRSIQEVFLELPTASAVLSFAPDPVLAESVDTLELTPLSLGP